MSRPRKNPAAVALGRIKSPAKARAARLNGRQGGRKPKFAIGDRARANAHAPIAYRGRIGQVTEVGPARAQFSVAYLDGAEPVSGQLMSWWLDPVRGASHH